MILNKTIQRHHLTIATLFIALALGVEAFVWELNARLRANTESKLIEGASNARALLEAEINEGIYITIGLDSYIRSRAGQVSITDIELWMATLFEYTRHLRNIGIAPNNRIEAVFPLQGNEAVLGLDYRSLPEQWPAIKAMMDSGEASLVGPITLVQGGEALIYRRPVYVEAEYWGLISTVMNLESILQVLDDHMATNPSSYSLKAAVADGYRLFVGESMSDPSAISRTLSIDLPGNYRLELTVSEAAMQWPLWLARLALWLIGGLLVIFGWQRYKARQIQLKNSREKVDFIHTISHELRTPLTSVSGALTLLAREPHASDTSDRLIDMASRNARRLERLVSEVLDIARLDASRMSFKLELLTIGPVLEQALENNVSLSDAHKVTLHIDGQPEALKSLVKADEQRLLQIMDNLISNAIKFSGEGQEVSIGVNQTKGNIDINVQDSGIGIPEHFQSQLFERFARLDQSDTRRNQNGTGLGLNIARDLARHMGGDINVRSKEGEGSCFTLMLPTASPR